MSTKITITHDKDYHVYQEMCEGERVYVQIDEHTGYLSVEDKKLTISLPPELLTRIAQGWLENQERFDTEPF